jgi:hypothetical protein
MDAPESSRDSIESSLSRATSLPVPGGSISRLEGGSESVGEGRPFSRTTKSVSSPEQLSESYPSSSLWDSADL